MVRLIYVFLLLLSTLPQARAAQTVQVGGYEFAPFVELDHGGGARGLAVMLIDAFNARQDAYEFRFVATSPSRRYKDFEDGKFDMLLFESPDWGWSARGAALEASTVFLDGGEVYVARRQAGRDQSYFNDFKGKRMVGILGYHYGFAGFDADPQTLKAKFQMTLVNSNQASIDMVLAGRGDVAVVTDSYLNRYLAQRPEARSQLLVSDRFDQVYAHRALVRRDGPIPVSVINGLLAAMQADGTLAALWRKAGVRP